MPLDIRQSSRRPDVRAAVLRHAGSPPTHASPAAAGLDEQEVEALRAIGIDAEEVVRRVEHELGTRLGGGSPARRTGRVPFSPDAKKVLELALREALSLKHGHIGTEHLLLGVLRAGRNTGSAALADLGVTHDAARAAVVAALRRTG